MKENQKRKEAEEKIKRAKLAREKADKEKEAKLKNQRLDINAGHLLLGRICLPLCVTESRRNTPSISLHSPQTPVGGSQSPCFYGLSVCVCACICVCERTTRQYL